jgi:hypothetical protein
LRDKKTSNLELLLVDSKWLSFVVVENMTFGRPSVNNNSATTVDWLPWFTNLLLKLKMIIFTRRSKFAIAVL